MANFIIGGTEKAGTTSVFVYLSEHPDVCAASKKETDFFRNGYIGESAQDQLNYSRYFDIENKECSIVMEASPGYLGEAALVVPRIHTLIPEAKFLFILRNPIDRLYSSYNFHVGKLNISENITFSDYVQRCLDYEDGTASAHELGMDEWYLKVMRFGCYAEHLSLYKKTFDGNNIKVLFFEDLKESAHDFMHEVSEYLRINPAFWDNYEFRKSNVTFSGQNKLLHKAAIWGNSITEPILRKHPKLKHRLVNLYKNVNQARDGYDPMPESARQKLLQYYQPSMDALPEIIGCNAPLSWRNNHQSTLTGSD
ncbi:MAG: sulfotransferase domain-containing protein [Gammaproteobacteria bacterium]|nr:sulfotransferase domain-containing protein [Gammaproteobacteria bacterium]MCP4090213.1 sulfotransferase domain-containing protein [Gammaproteobacteria bacterium]MCP4832964.1 sulfotransferase domain-containing protein [Gammaproteobacteria bacterium]